MLITAVAVVLGAIAGATALYLVTLALGDGLSGVIVALPGISDADLVQARAELAEQGPVAFLNGILQGLPVKVYIHAAALDGIELAQVVFFTLLNRVERLLVFGLVIALLGWLGRPAVRRWPRGCLALYGVAWVIFYAGFLLGRGG